MKIIITLILGFSIIGGVYKLGHDNGYAQSQAEVQAQIAKANEAARATEQSLNSKITDLTTQLVKVQNEAQKQIAKRDADIATGKLQLFVKTKGTVCPSKDAGPSSGSDTATAQLDPKTATDLVSVTDDGDTAIRKLNACIATYNQVKELINGSTTTR